MAPMAPTSVPPPAPSVPTANDAGTAAHLVAAALPDQQGGNRAARRGADQAAAVDRQRAGRQPPVVDRVRHQLLRHHVADHAGVRAIPRALSYCGPRDGR